MELREWDICESLSSILSVQSPKGWRPPFLSSAASVHRTKSALLFVPIRKSALLFVPVTQSALLFDPVSRLSAPPGVAAAGVAGPRAGVTAGEGAGCAAAAAGDEGVLGGISARWQRCAWVATGAPVSRTLRPFDRAECDGSASHDRRSHVEQLSRDLVEPGYVPTAAGKF